MWRGRATRLADVHRAGCTGVGVTAWLLAFPGAVPTYAPSLEFRGDLFRTAVQHYLGAPLSELAAAGLPAGGRPCWMLPKQQHRGPRQAEAGVAASLDEDGAPEGPTPPSQAPQDDQAPAAGPRCALSRGVRVHVCCRGRHLFDCNVGGHNLWTHNCVASATPAIAPSSDVQDWPGALRMVITDHEKMQKYLRGRAPCAPGSGAWPTPDAICPPTPGSGGRPTYVDVVVTDPTLASRLHATRLLPAVEAVDAATRPPSRPRRATTGARASPRSGVLPVLAVVAT